jgi:hypothetical protein
MIGKPTIFAHTTISGISKGNDKMLKKTTTETQNNTHPKKNPPPLKKKI